MRKIQTIMKLSAVLAFLAAGASAFAQNIVKGSVTDEKGEPLPGASVLVEGTTRGSITDAEGSYEIEASPEDVLNIDFIGYTTGKVTVGGQSVINVTLQPSTEFLEETVVVGYGVQKKVNLTGSVASVNYAEMAESRPITTTASLLRGASAGVYVSQGSGQPGAESIDIKIRGNGTLNDSSPLVIVDGFEATMSRVNPADIESVSILKDAASCAIYGNRAANGVILITTKTAKKGTFNVDYSGLFSYEEPMHTVKKVSNYADYMELANEAYENIGAAKKYSQSRIDLWRAAEKDPNGIAESGYPNYVAYPNVDWNEAIFTPGLYQKHTLSAGGSTGAIRFHTSIDYMNNPGIFAGMGYRKFAYRANLSADVTKWLEVGTRIFGFRGDNDITDWGAQMGMISRSLPDIYPYYDGKYGWNENLEDSSLARNSWFFIRQANGKSTQHNINASAYFTVKFPYDIKLHTSFNYQWDNNRKVFTRYPLTAYSFSRDEIAYDQSSLSGKNQEQTHTYAYNWTIHTDLNWNHSFGKHDVGALVGFEAFDYLYQTTTVSKKNLSNAVLTELDNFVDVGSASGSSTSYSTASFFGRATYAYDSRYLAEVNFRYDGSSRFARESRWGFFPSVSAGWRINKEPWMSDVKIDNLKLRASWGKLGNHAIGNYEYISLYSSGYNYPFDGTMASGYISTLSNDSLEWETTSTVDVGVDFGVFNNRLTAEFDFYNKVTDGILDRSVISSCIGTKSAPKENLYTMLNRGLELTVGWKDSKGDFTYGVSANMTRNWNNVKKYRGVFEAGWVEDENGIRTYRTNYGETVNSSALTSIITEGHPVTDAYLMPIYHGDGTYFFADGCVNPNGGPKDGMIRTPDDMKWLEAMFAAGNRFGPQNKTIGKNGIWYGDYILADVNGDNMYGGQDDKVNYGSKQPTFYFGFNFYLAWKGLDFSLDLMGALGGRTFWKAESYNCMAYSVNCTYPAEYAYDHYFYDPENPSDPRTNLTSKNGRVTADYGSEQNGGYTDLWLQKLDYLKIKGLTLGYTFPQRWMDKIHVKKLRVFFSGDNLYCFTSYKNVDPEYPAKDNFYSSLRQLTLGINVGF